MEYTNLYVLKDAEDGEIYAVVNTELSYDMIDDIIVSAKEDSCSEEEIIDRIYDAMGNNGTMIEALDLAGVFNI